MKIKGLKDKIYRVNSNSVLCDIASFDKLKEGGSVDLPNEAAEELLNMGVAKKAKSTISKKESK
jgi:hypothetical protein|tara:strand:+ start:161 stop:352 length:192 start_codon:yes stop_codon:yes gene_type:complete